MENKSELFEKWFEKAGWDPQYKMIALSAWTAALEEKVKDITKQGEMTTWKT